MTEPGAEAVLFDFDGVLVDSARAVEVAWERWSSRRGVQFAELRAVFHGRRTEEVVELVAPGLDAVQEAAWIEGLILEVDGGGSSIEGPRRLYEAVAGGRRAVVTSARRETAESRIDHLALDEPGALITADDVNAGKPRPDCYLLGARLLGVDPSRCLVIEDAPAGIEAGRAARMRVLAVTTTHTAHELEAADRVIAPDDLPAEVLPLLAPVAKRRSH